MHLILRFIIIHAFVLLCTMYVGVHVEVRANLLELVLYMCSVEHTQASVAEPVLTELPCLLHLTMLCGCYPWETTEGKWRRSASEGKGRLMW